MLINGGTSYGLLWGGIKLMEEIDHEKKLKIMEDDYNKRQEKKINEVITEELKERLEIIIEPYIDQFLEDFKKDFIKSFLTIGFDVFNHIKKTEEVKD